MTTPELSRAILACPMDPALVAEQGAPPSATVGEFIANTAAQLWLEGEGFSGKRPFGNSGWDWAIGQTLEDNGMAPTVLEIADAIRTMR